MKSSLTWVYTAVELSHSWPTWGLHSPVDPVFGEMRDIRYLYFILKRAWSVAVSASEARGPREDKERSEEKRPWSWSCRTWLKEWRISVRHDAINPENRRASG